MSHAGTSGELELLGTLRWNEFEGGFWSLELDEADPALGQHVTLAGFTPSGEDGSRARLRVRVEPDRIGFQMAGPMADVLEELPAD